MVENGRLAHFTRAQQLNRVLFDELAERADRFRQLQRAQPLSGKILVLEFYEPSTRTRQSFEAAMTRLGGAYTSTENAAAFSSFVKGESYEDTVRVIGAYGDAIVVRSKEVGVADRMAALSEVPVINAGDGTGQHPTQALLDLYTIKKEMGKIDKLNIAIVGDLLHGRTAKSLAYLLGNCSDEVTITFVSPDNLRIDAGIKEHLDNHGKTYSEERDLNEVLRKRGGSEAIDVVYLTRVQRERMTPEEYERSRGRLVFDKKSLELLVKGNPNARVMHPLPKVDEIDLPIEVEQTNQAIAYFRQSKNGLFVRMALLYHMLRD